MAQYGANDLQTIQPNGYFVFTTTIVPCDRGLIGHAVETPIFSLSGWRPNNGCCCERNKPTLYETCVNFNAALSEGATVEPIRVAITVEGVPVPFTEMDSTPAAVGDFNHLSLSCVQIPIIRQCCQTVAVQNISTQPIDVRNLLISFKRPDLANA